MGVCGHLVGMALSFGLHRDSWQELQAWASLMGQVIAPPEADFIMDICAAYRSACAQYSGREMPRPWHNGKIDHDAVAASMRAALRS